MPIFKDPQFDALRNAIYHTARGRFLDALNRFVNFSVIILGATAVSKIADQYKVGDNWIELAIVVIATGQLVFDFGGRASVHLYLQKRYYELLSELETSDIDDQEGRKLWSAKLLTIAADKPLPMRALDAIAYNSALDSLVDDPEKLAKYRLYISPLKRWLAQVCAFQGSQFVCQSDQIGFWSKLKDWLCHSKRSEKPNG
jgi:hypothetical protein